MVDDYKIDRLVTINFPVHFLERIDKLKDKNFPMTPRSKVILHLIELGLSAIIKEPNIEDAQKNP